MNSADTARLAALIPADVTAVCDNTSVGVLIPGPAGRLLMVRRLRPPFGIAPVAGHVDDHNGIIGAAIAEVAEEVGLEVQGLKFLGAPWRDNICRRRPGPLGFGHAWNLYLADTTGTVTTAPDETAEARWYEPAEIQQLAERTVAYARGRISTAAFTAEPGLEPVWVRFLAELRLIHLSIADLALVDTLACRSPYEPPDGVR